MKKLIKITERFTFLAKIFTLCSDRKSVDAEDPAIIPEPEKNKNDDKEIGIMPISAMERRERRKAVTVFRNGS